MITKKGKEAILRMVLRNNEYFYFYVFLTTVDTIGHNRRFAYLIELLVKDTIILEIKAVDCLLPIHVLNTHLCYEPVFFNPKLSENIHQVRKKFNRIIIKAKKNSAGFWILLCLNDHNNLKTII